MVALRDGRKLIGVLRSWDQFGMAHGIGQSYYELVDRIVVAHTRLVR